MRLLAIFMTFLTAQAAMASAAILPADEAAKLFGSRSTAWDADVSPSGRKILFLSAGPRGHTIAKLFDRDTRAVRNLLVSDGKPESLRWCAFASEVNIICQFGGNVAEGRQVIGFSRLVTLSTATGKLQSLGRRQNVSDAYVRQFDGAVLDWMPDSTGSVLMARTHVPEAGNSNWRLVNRAEGLGVERIDLNTLKAQQVEPPHPKAEYYMTDGRGTVRLVALSETEEEMLTGKVRYRYRTPNSSEWRDLGTYRVDTDVGMRPQAIESASNTLYYLKKVDGRDALFQMVLDGSGTEKLIAKHPSVDIDGVIRVDTGGKVVGYHYTDDRFHAEYFDPDIRKLATGLSRAIPATPLIQFAGSSRDGNTLLIHASADTDAGAFYVLDRATKKMEPVLNSREPLVGRALAPVRSVLYPAADGTMIPAYVTIAAGLEAKSLPAIVLPHGGPSARDEWGFDWLAQFLAARGYAVIQPNYRGSAGYGDDFLGENAFKGWRTAMTDISDASRYLVTQGIADPNRLAVVGWSYGGYAALQSAALEPQRYKAVVAIAPVTDLIALKAEAQGFTNARITERFIGSGEHLRAGSPLANAAAIKAPVLLVHGDLDGNVHVSHSVKMADALAKRSTPVEFLRYAGLDHYLDDSDVRTAMLARVAALLDRTIGQPAK